MKPTAPDTPAAYLGSAVVGLICLGLAAQACSGPDPAANTNYTGTTGMPPGTGGSTAVTSTTGMVAAGGTMMVGAGGTGVVEPTPEECATGVYPNRTPIRRLTEFEYSNTLETLLGDETNPGSSLPAEVSGTGFGNDADNQPVSSFLAEQYGVIAEDVATRAEPQFATFAPCYSAVTTDTEEACTRTFVENFAAKAYRRPLDETDLEGLLWFYDEGQAGGGFIICNGDIQQVFQFFDL